MDDFGKIVLTDDEKKILEELKNGSLKKVSENKNSLSHLKSIGFVVYLLGTNDGKITRAGDLLYAKITDEGERYLLYCSNIEKRKREGLERTAERTKQQFRHDWKIAVFSSVAGAILSRPIWSGIDWFVQFISALILK